MAKKDTLMATVATAGSDEPDDEKDESPNQKSGGKLPGPAKSAKPETPFFTIYKKGQGKWTRLGTVAAAGLLACLTAYNLYLWILPALPVAAGAKINNNPQHILIAGCALFLGFLALIIFWVGNKPSNVDFLIATDSEMKKVNWTTKGELFGSTRVVVLFLIFIGCFLFLVDTLFAAFFKLIHVLQ
jgi:preprotein translocase SecE subunit